MIDHGSCGRGCGCAGKDEELRCVCGNLLARLVPGGVELFCRRCKRRVIVPLESAVSQVPVGT